jgi:arabinofuranosyltransferase
MTAQDEDEAKGESTEDEDGDEEVAEPPKSAPSAPKPAKKKPWALLTLLSLVLLAVVWVYATAPSHIVLDQGVEVTSVTLPEEITPGGTLPLTFKLHATKPLASDMWFFIHVESTSGNPSACRMVHDQPPTPLPTQWKDQEITHSVTIAVPPSCKPGRFEVFAGLYDRQTWARLKVLQPRTVDNRVHAGFIDVVAESASTSTRTITPRSMALQEYRGLVQPWLPWLGGIGVAILFAIFLHTRRTANDDDEDKASATMPLDKRVRWVSWGLPAIPFFLGILVVLEFVKDDAYISFRYAHNLVTGHGLVFNQGEKLEGFTNFLWVLILAPFEWLGWDLFQVCEVLGTILGIACLVQATKFVTWINGERKDFSQLWAAMWLATSSSFVLWAKSGLEQPLAQLLPIVGAWILWRARTDLPLSKDATTTKRLEKRYLIAGILMGMACMTRPELHMMAILVGLPLVLDAVKTRKVSRAQLLYVAGILAITIPCHGFRYAYYGTLVPNTFYVKTGTGSLVWREGIKTLHDMFDFNDTGALVVLAPLAFVDRKRIVEKSVMAIISLAFMAFYVKVGVDEMQWHRLYLPALPFTAVLAALGAQNLLDGILRLTKSESLRTVAYGVAWGAVLLAGYQSFRFTYREQHGFDGHGDLAGTYHPDLGKFLVRHERPGALVAFQDMGSTPYHAPDIDFLDFIGLVDKTVAHARHDYGLHAFVGADVDNNQGKYDAEMREYFYKRNPEWTILTIYTPRGEEQRIAQMFDADPGPNALGDTFNNNPYQFGIYADARFRQRYVHVRTWQRSVGYYLSLWRRKDLWEQTPREVVLDAPPTGISGVKVKFENGLEILGSDLTKETLERHEVFITTWWKLPGPMPKDTVFFVHVSAPGFQAPGDHTPGDWMWPGDRWQAGQILEDRTLFQLPPFTMKPGKYDVYLGVYNRSTGERLKIVEGPNDGQNRVLLGSFDVHRLQPLIHQLIPPTRVDVMRKYPDRIIDSHRPFGQ